MTSQCIHGFSSQQCVACRTCDHGMTASACLRCRAVVPARRSVQPPVVDYPNQSHQGYEIYYVPAVSGWQYRAADSAPSGQSYRSAFLARKAVDRLLADPPVEPRKSARAKRAS